MIKNEDEIKLYIDDSCFIPSSSSSSITCRICHEEEDENSTSMESPCACSGTLKFAHRDCVQRWCDEKGSSVCEICLQKYEPGYIVSPKVALVDIAVTIRRSLEVPRLNYETETEMLMDEFESDQEYTECSPSYDARSICFRFTTLILLFILLARHFYIIVSNGEGHYPFALITVILLRAIGIVLPFYFIMKTIASIQRRQRQYHHQQLRQNIRREATSVHRDEQPEHTIDIYS